MRGDLVMTGATADEIWPLVRDHHYSRAMPASVVHAFAWRRPGGLFGDTGEPLAGALYSPPSGRGWPDDALELSRLVRLPSLDVQLSAFVAWTLRWLRANTSFGFVLSYADDGQDHHGGIYQASGFSYVAYRHSKHFEFFGADGNRIHQRTINQRFGTSSAEVLARDPSITRQPSSAKYLYVKPLRQNLKPLLRRFAWTELPYPKPHAARLLDAPVPAGASEARTLGAAPTQAEAA